MDQMLYEKSRAMILNECQRQVFDALVLPLPELELKGKEEKQWLSKARILSGNIDWNTYSTTRDSFMMQAYDMLSTLGMPLYELDPIRNRMYIRFMEGRIRYFQYLEKKEQAEFPPIPVGQVDIPNTEMAAVFAHLQQDEGQKEILENCRVRWDYEQLHMVTWFSCQLSLGEGLYSRSRPNHSARVTYERLLNPYSLLWIALALGEDQDLILDANEAMKPHKDYRDKAIAIRNRIPYSRIYCLALPLVEKEREKRMETA